MLRSESKRIFYSCLQNPSKIKVDDVEINYLKVGNGPQTLMLLPGALGTQFITVIKVFESTFPVIRHKS